MKTHPILIKQAQLGGSTFVCVTFIRSQKSGTRHLYSQFWGWKSGCDDGGTRWRVVAPSPRHPPRVPHSQPPDSSRTSNTSTLASPSLPHPYYIFTLPQSPLSFRAGGGGRGREREKKTYLISFIFYYFSVSFGFCCFLYPTTQNVKGFQGLKIVSSS